MKLKWVEFETTVERDLKTIIDRSTELDGSIEDVEQKVSDLATFSTKAIELLYKKGLITKQDIVFILEDFETLDEEGLEIID